MGLPLSYVIDILRPATSEVRFRLYYQDTATNSPEGFPPHLGDGKEFDLAVLCVTSFGQVDDHPEAIVKAIRPRTLPLTHWENFFKPQSEPPEPVPGTDVDEFVECLEAILPQDTPYWMPAPGETISINFDSN